MLLGACGPSFETPRDDARLLRMTVCLGLRPLAQKFFAERAYAKRQIVEQIQQIYPTGKSPQKSVKPRSQKYSDFQK